MFKYLRAMTVAVAILLLASPVSADIISNIIADIESVQTGNNTATAINKSGSNNQVIASSGAVNLNIENGSGTKIKTTLNLDLDITQHGNNTAEAVNRGGSYNKVRATAGVLSINLN